MQVGRSSDEINQLSSWAGAVTQKTTRKRQKKLTCYRQTNQPNIRPTDRASYRVAYMRVQVILKKKIDILKNRVTHVLIKVPKTILSGWA